MSWPDTVDGWLERLIPESARLQLQPSTRRMLIRGIFDGMSVIEQLVWVVTYGGEPPSAFDYPAPGTTVTVSGADAIFEVKALWEQL